MWTVNVIFTVDLDGGIDEYEYMDAHMFLFNRALLDAEGLGDSVGLLKLQLLLLGIWQDSLRRSVFEEQAEAFSANLLAKEYLRNCSGPLTRRTLSS